MHTSKEELFESLAKQLRHPAGIMGKEVAEKMNKGNRLMNLETIKQLNVSDNDHILEIGMGNGFFVGDILSLANNVTYYGCDTSADMVEQAIALNGEWINRQQASFITGRRPPPAISGWTVSKDLHCQHHLLLGRCNAGV